MTIDEVYNLTKETMKNWKVTPTYSVVAARYGYPSDTQFSVEIEVSKSGVIELTTSVLIKDFSYSVNMEFYGLENLENYLGKLDELDDDTLSDVRQEMSDVLSSHFRDLFQYGKQ
jgi:hypothetical protein